MPTRAELDFTHSLDPVAVAAAVHDADGMLHLATRIRSLKLMQQSAAWRDNDRLRGEASAILVDAAPAACPGVYIQPTVTLVYPRHRAVSEDTPACRGAPILRFALVAE
jgi:hypothetical protein